LHAESLRWDPKWNGTQAVSGFICGWTKNTRGGPLSFLDITGFETASDVGSLPITKSRDYIKPTDREKESEWD